MGQSILLDLTAEWVTAGYVPFLFAGLILAGVGTLLLFCLGLTAYHRHRSREYLFVTLVLGALVIRTIVGWGTVVGIVPMVVHHLLEHGLDFLIATIVLYTVYRSRSRPATNANGKNQYTRRGQS